MQVHILKLRSRGKKLSPEELRVAHRVEGHLEIIKYQTNTRAYSYATVQQQASGGMVHEVCHLYEPKLISIEGDSMLFDGVEKDSNNGEMFFQQWRCVAG